MRKPVIALIVVLAACSPDGATESTTTTLDVATSTTMPSQTTSTNPPTTTTTGAVTTTTTGPTTTAEGNWASEPLIAVGFGAVGWWDGESWLDAQDQGTLPVSGGEDYQVTTLGELTMTSGGPQTIVCEPLELIGVELADGETLGDWPGPMGVAVSAPWQVQPHGYEEISDDGTYAGFASDLLQTRELDVADPVVKQLIRTDLEGDGVDEVLVVAEEVTTGLLMEEGDYSIAFLRKVVQGEVQTAILGETVVLGEEDRFAGAHSVGGVADLNGDGKMEIITNSGFFEGMNVTIWEYVNDDLGPVVAVETGCGV